MNENIYDDNFLKEIEEVMRNDNIDELNDRIMGLEENINDFRFENGTTLLMLAAKCGAQDIVKFLINNGADVNAVDDHGNNIFHYLTFNLKNNNNELFELFSNYTCCDSINSDNLDGQTPLHLAVKNNNLDIVRHLLVKSEIDVNSLDILFLIDNNTDIELVKLLLQFGDNINIQNNSGLTLLHLAAMDNKSKIIQLLLEDGADVNIKTKSGLTPLHWAAAEGYLECVQLLLENGADVNIKTEYGETPYQMANNEEIKQLIRQKESNQSVDDEIEDVEQENQIRFSESLWGTEYTGVSTFSDIESEDSFIFLDDEFEDISTFSDIESEDFPIFPDIESEKRQLKQKEVKDLIGDGVKGVLELDRQRRLLESLNGAGAKIKDQVVNQDVALSHQ